MTQVRTCIYVKLTAVGGVMKGGSEDGLVKTSERNIDGSRWLGDV
jgi:hypothetical protein